MLGLTDFIMDFDSPVAQSGLAAIGQAKRRTKCSVSISKNVTLSGGPNDIWIFKIAGALKQASAARITLAGGA
jgi:hypothetical protein